MEGRTSKKRMTLSERLAQRARAAEEAQALEEEQARRVQNLEALRATPGCTCPACLRLRARQSR